MTREVGDVHLTGSNLSLEQLLLVARGRFRVEFSPAALERMEAARKIVDRTLERGDTVYGLTTGVGARKVWQVDAGRVHEFNRLLIVTHRAAQGPAVAEDVIRATLVCLANGFASGRAGVRPALALRLVDALNADEYPRVRLLGSIGVGDLAPHADLAAGVLHDLPLEAIEALAFINNNAFSTALSALALADLQRLLRALEIGAALDIEAFGANLTILHPIVGELRSNPNFGRVVQRFRSLLRGSYLWDPESARNLQDPLSFRAIPQIHSAAEDAAETGTRQLTVELNSSQENPVVVQSEERIISAPSFDILPLAAAVDYVRIALAPVLTVACERTLKLLDGRFSGLPMGLSPEEGRSDCSLEILGISAQALTAEARLLASPVSYEVVSSTGADGIEDRMNMAPLSARRLAEQAELGERLLAIALVVASQAVEIRDMRQEIQLGVGTQRAFDLVRDRIPFAATPELFPVDLDPVRDLVHSGVINAVWDHGDLL